jgi:hypothetical protein
MGGGTWPGLSKTGNLDRLEWDFDRECSIQNCSVKDLAVALLGPPARDEAQKLKVGADNLRPAWIGFCGCRTDRRARREESWELECPIQNCSAKGLMDRLSGHLEEGVRSWSEKAGNARAPGWDST